jgi:Sensors of blue-light using FAD
MPEPVPDPVSTQWPDSGSEVPLQPVARLVYASISQVDGPVLQEMRRIRDQALLRNEADGLRVALLHICGWFVEWIEGPEPAIEALLARVERDPRHHSLRVLHRSVGQPRLLRPWIGAIVQSDESMVDVARRVLDLQHRHETDRFPDPGRVWLSLCSPPAASMRSPIGAFPRVMLLSVAGSTAFDLTTWIARETGQPLIRRRFAGAADDAPDVESDYVDLPDVGPAGLRLIANARKGLAMGMTHAFLPDYAAVLVLLDEDESRNQRLLARVLAACRQVHHAPIIIGAGHRVAIGVGLQSLVEKQGYAWQAVDLGSARAGLAATWQAVAPVLAMLGSESTETSQSPG